MTISTTATKKPLPLFHVEVMGFEGNPTKKGGCLYAPRGWGQSSKYSYFYEVAHPYQPKADRALVGACKGNLASYLVTMTAAKAAIAGVDTSSMTPINADAIAAWEAANAPKAAAPAVEATEAPAVVEDAAPAAEQVTTEQVEVSAAETAPAKPAKGKNKGKNKGK
jgi:hypothetical protein